MANVRLRLLVISVWLGIIGIASGQVNEMIGVSVMPTKLWRFMDGHDRIVAQRFREAIDEFSVGDIRCLRYCIESKASMEEMPSVANLIWKLENKSVLGSTPAFDKDFRPEEIRGESIKPGSTRGKCTFSIVIGCELSKSTQGSGNLGETEKRFIKSLQPNVDIIEDSGDKGSPALNFLRKKLVDEAGLKNETEVEFHVQPNQAEISVVVFGNVSMIDLKMPIATDIKEATKSAAATTVATPRLALATTRMPGGAAGVRLNVVNPPPGGWRLKIQGLLDQTYRLVVVQAVVPEFSDEGPQSLKKEDNNLQNPPKASGISSRMIQVLDDVDDMVDTRLSDDTESKHALLPRMMSEDQSGTKVRFPDEPSKIVTLDLNDNNNLTTRMDIINDDSIESRVIDRSFVDLADFSNPLNEELPIRKYLTVELSQRTELIANPGSYHRLIFEITNSHVLRIRHYLFPTSNPFPIVGLPRFVDVAPGQSISVPVDIAVPPNVGDTVNKVTLRVEGIEITEKSANFYVRSSSARLYDDRRPDIDYYFNGNCNGKSSGESCLKSFWSVDIIVQDFDSGLKTVTSTPKGLYARAPYVSGTSSPVKFYYANNCCNRFIEVTAMDVSGNVYSRKIDVDVWYNLTTGEILAIIFIIFFIILLIILIAILIVYCIRRRQSQDLPYSQRYGSRSSPQ